MAARSRTEGWNEEACISVNVWKASGGRFRTLHHQGWTNQTRDALPQYMWKRLLRQRQLVSVNPNNDATATRSKTGCALLFGRNGTLNLAGATTATSRSTALFLQANYAQCDAELREGTCTFINPNS